MTETATDTATAAAMTKFDQAIAMYQPEMTPAEFTAKIQAELGMSLAAARTYSYNVRQKLGVPVKMRGFGKAVRAERAKEKAVNAKRREKRAEQKAEAATA